MAGTKKPIDPDTFTNPFLSNDREALWKRIEQNAKPIPKEEVLKRAAELKKQSGRRKK